MKAKRKRIVTKSDTKLDTVGVAGSIPVEPTIFEQPFRLQVCEIPTKSRIVPSIEWSGGLPVLGAVFLPDSRRQCDFSVTFSQRKKRVRAARSGGGSG